MTVDPALALAAAPILAILAWMVIEYRARRVFVTQDQLRTVTEKVQENETHVSDLSKLVDRSLHGVETLTKAMEAEQRLTAATVLEPMKGLGNKLDALSSHLTTMGIGQETNRGGVKSLAKTVDDLRARVEALEREQSRRSTG